MAPLAGLPGPASGFPRSGMISPGRLPVTARLLLFRQDRILLHGGEVFWPAPAAGPLLGDNPRLLPVAEDCFAADLSGREEKESRSLRSLLFSESDVELELLSRASQLVHWQRTHRFCGLCGESTRPGDTDRVLECIACGHQFFPRINPCVIVLVTRGGEILLARSARYRSGFYSCLAGFIEIGETPEQTLAREVREEVGVEVENIRYAQSQSWPFPSQLMLGFLADYRSGEIVPEPGEIEDARWFAVSDLPKIPSSNISVAGKLIEGYVRSLHQHL